MLSEAIQKSWRNHPSIDAAAASAGYASRETKEEYSAYLPDLNVTASGGRQFANNSTSRGLSTVRGSGYSNIWDANVSLRQQIFDAGGRSNRVESARVREQMAEINFLDIKDILASTVASSYIELLRVYQSLSMLSAHANIMSDYITRMESAVAEGVIDDGEYRQAQEVKLSLEILRNEFNIQLKSAEAAYLEVVGELPSGELTTPLLGQSAIPSSMGQAIDQALANYPALQRARLQSESVAFDVEAERSAFFPTIDGELSYLKSEKRDVIGGESEEAKALMRMNWNFETGGGALHRVSKQKFQHEEALANVRELSRQTERQVRLSYAEYEGAIAALQTQNKRQTLSQNLFQTYQEQFEGARISLLQLMQAENAKFQSNLDQVAAQHRVLNAQYAILSALGRSQIIVSGASMAEAISR